MTNEGSRILLAFGAILRKLSWNLKVPGQPSPLEYAGDISLPWLSLECTRHSFFFIRLFHLHSMFPRYSPGPTGSPSGVPSSSLHLSGTLFLHVPQNFSGPTSRPLRKLQLGRIWRKFRSPSLPWRWIFRWHGTHILFARNLQRGKDRSAWEMSPEFDLNNSVRIPESTMSGMRERARHERSDFYFDFYFIATLFCFLKRSRNNRTT